ncbi:LysM peptidoglycan-binding domain-containing protein [Actinoplanes sp. NBC_00393]|uniref:BTAD domain-containing putative transcriptional regulator n=1 Tax=Actinoplanes sp. NBC_00393 TaxID=2975953 RepID=UPI002E1ABB0F
MVAAIRVVVVACALLFGVPALLFAVAGSPLPAQTPSAEQWQLWANDPLHPRYAGATARTVMWLVWALLAVLVAAAVAARVRRLPWSRAAGYLPGPLQGLAATLIGAATVTTATTTADAHEAVPVTASVPDYQPVARTLEPAQTEHRATVTVRRGDTLSGIAQRKLRDAERWPEIFALNRNKHFPDVGGRLHDPDVIYPGWRLQLPADAAPKPRTPARPKPATPAPTKPSEPAATAAPAATEQANEDRATADEGVTLPGGWISLPLAAALVAAAVMVWLQRRRRYVPPAVIDSDIDDSHLRPLPAVLTTIKRQVRRRDPALLDPPAPQPTVAQHNAAAPADQPTTGLDGLQLAGLDGRMPADGWGLTGPGAHAAARGLLVATLSSGSPADPDAKGQVIVAADTLEVLLGAAGQRYADMPRLHPTADLGEALTRAEELIVERRRILQEHDAADLAELRATEPFHPPMPQVLLLATAPPTDLRGRLATTVRLGASLQIAVVVLGDWTDGDTLTVADDGTTGTERIAVLDTPTALQLLDVLHEAHTGTPVTAAVSATDGPPSSSPAQPVVQPAAAGEPPNDSPPHTVRVRLLGEPAILDSDGKPMTGLRHHARGLLVYLAVHRDGARLPDLMEAFWPAATVRRASERLSTEVANLRRTIRQAAGDKSIQPVINTGGHYHLDPKLLDIDIWQVADALRQAATAEPGARLALLSRAVDAHSGVLAAGCDYEWIEQPREHFRRLGVRARLEAAELIERDDPKAAADLLGDAAAIDPINEELARRAIRAIVAVGDHAGARSVMEHLHAALHHINEEPSEQTTTLAAELIASRDRHSEGF